MKKILFCIIFLQAAIFLSSTALGSVIELKDGSKIVGQIEKISKETVHLKTDFTGIIKIDMNRIVSMLSETPLYFTFKSGNRLYGTLKYNIEQIQIDTPDGSIKIEPGTLVAAWQKGQPDPMLPEKRKWKYKVGFDISGKTGNTERFGTGGRVAAILKGPEDQLLFYLRNSYAKENGNETDNEIISGIDFETQFSKKHSWYARIELENDEIEDLDLRATAALGYGYYFIKNTSHIIRGRVGFMYRHESYDHENSNSTTGLDFGIYHLYKFSDWGKLVTDITYTPSIEYFSEYRLFHDSAFEFPLAKSKKWKLRLGMTNEYNNEVATDKEKLDTSYYSRIVVDW